MCYPDRLTVPCRRQSHFDFRSDNNFHDSERKRTCLSESVGQACLRQGHNLFADNSRPSASVAVLHVGVRCAIFLALSTISGIASWRFCFFFGSHVISSRDNRFHQLGTPVSYNISAAFFEKRSHRSTILTRPHAAYDTQS